MATVYLAHDLKHDRKVAIKVVRPELAAVIGPDRFVREIKTIANLQHPHILGLIDSGEIDGTAYYVMPFVEGESLRDRLQRDKQLPIGDAVRITTEVAGCPRLRPSPRRDPPRHQAREHPAARRQRAGGRFRHRARRQQRRHQDDRDRDVARHAAVHVAGTGDGRAGDHRGVGCVCAGLRRLRDVDRRPAVQRLDGAGDRGAGGHRATALAHVAAAHDSDERRTGGAHRAGEAPGRPLRHGWRIRRCARRSRLHLGHDRARRRAGEPARSRLRDPVFIGVGTVAVLAIAGRCPPGAPEGRGPVLPPISFVLATTDTTRPIDNFPWPAAISPDGGTVVYSVVPPGASGALLSNRLYFVRTEPARGTRRFPAPMARQNRTSLLMDSGSASKRPGRSTRSGSTAAHP